MPVANKTTTHTVNKEELAMKLYLCKIQAELNKIKNISENDYAINEVNKISEKLKDIDSVVDEFVTYDGQTMENYKKLKKLLDKTKEIVDDAHVESDYEDDKDSAQKDEYAKENKIFDKMKVWVGLAVKRADHYISMENDGCFDYNSFEGTALRKSEEYIAETKDIRFGKTCDYISDLRHKLAATNRSLLTKQSKQFKNFRKAVVSLIGALNQGVNEKSAEMIVGLINNVKECKEKYDKHCIKHPKDNAVRTARVNLVEDVMNQIEKLNQNDFISKAQGIEPQDFLQPNF